jgi:hypothetical protein
LVPDKSLEKPLLRRCRKTLSSDVAEKRSPMTSPTRGRGMPAQRPHPLSPMPTHRLGLLPPPLTRPLPHLSCLALSGSVDMGRRENKTEKEEEKEERKRREEKEKKKKKGVCNPRGSDSGDR